MDGRVVSMGRWVQRKGFERWGDTEVVESLSLI